MIRGDRMTVTALGVRAANDPCLQGQTTPDESMPGPLDEDSQSLENEILRHAARAGR